LLGGLELIEHLLFVGPALFALVLDLFLFRLLLLRLLLGGLVVEEVLVLVVEGADVDRRLLRERARKHRKERASEPDRNDKLHVHFITPDAWVARRSVFLAASSVLS